MFSELCDLVGSRCNRTDKILTDIPAYVNQTLSECQSMKMAAYDRDMIEYVIPVTTPIQEPITWDRPSHMRGIRTVQYVDATGMCKPRYPKFRRPGKTQDAWTEYYYAAGQYYVFAGLVYKDQALSLSTVININIAYYAKFRRYKYYPIGSRPATYDFETESWSFIDPLPTIPPNWDDSPLNLTSVDMTNYTQQQQYAIYLVMNWMLLNYFDTIGEGSVAKLTKSVGDQRAPSSFALYKSLQNDMVANEKVSSFNFDDSGES